MSERGVRRLAWVLGTVAALGLAGLFVMFGPLDVAARVSTAEFCDSCHLMDPEYAAWKFGIDELLWPESLSALRR